MAASCAEWVHALTALMNTNYVENDALMGALCETCSKKEAVAGATNLCNVLKASSTQFCTAALETAGIPSAKAAEAATQLAHHLFKRFVSTLLTCTHVMGTGKVAAFRTTLQRDRFWVAGFGVCANVATWALCPDEFIDPLLGQESCLWMQTAYEMWHMARHFKVALQHDAQIRYPESVHERLTLLMAVLECTKLWSTGSLEDALRSHAQDSEHCDDPDLSSALAIVMPLKVFFRAVVNTAIDWVSRAGLDVLSTTQVGFPGASDTASDEILDFMLCCLDHFLAESLHILVGSELGVLVCLCTFSAMKAAAHRDLALVKEGARISDCASSVARTAPGAGTLALGPEALTKTCLQLYNGEIVKAYGGMIRAWIEKAKALR